MAVPEPELRPGGTVAELVGEGCCTRSASGSSGGKAERDDPGRDPITLHRHQRDAIEAARTGGSYVLTTGTGSGKSLAYIVPIVDRVLRDKDAAAAAPPGSRRSSSTR